MKFKSLSFFVLASLIAVSGIFFNTNTVLASCDPRSPQVSNPPHITSISAPTGIYTDPITIPVVITGDGSYLCEGDPKGGMGWDNVMTEVTYTITDNSGSEIYTGYWTPTSCTVPICAPRPINVNTTMPASAWPAGNYTITVVATGPAGQDDPITQPPYNTDTASSTFTIARDTPPTPYYSTSCTPATQTIALGGTTSFGIATTAYNGFNSPVTFTPTISPSTGTPPTISFTNNGATPSATTTAVVNTTGSTTPGTYTLTFTGNSTGVPPNCSVQLVVGAGFSFSITPNPATVVMGNDVSFNVEAVCTGGFTGQIGTLVGSSTFSNLLFTFSPTSVTCDAPNNVTTLTVGNTGAVPQSQLSTIQSVLYKTITVTGQAVNSQ